MTLDAISAILDHIASDPQDCTDAPQTLDGLIALLAPLRSSPRPAESPADPQAAPSSLA